jgi:CubicO group peptidase (beta-lactamase class C family)
MIRIASSLHFAILFLAAQLVCALSAPAASMPAGYTPGIFARSIQPYIDDKTIVGAVLLVAPPSGPDVIETAGMADVDGNRPMAADTIFRIASMTKSLTACGMMVLVDQGKVRLDDPVEKYLPQFHDLKVQTRQSDGQIKLENASHPVTIREMLTHTSGLQYAKMATLAEAADAMARMPLLDQPRTHFHYTDAGFTVAGRIIEVVSGTSYEQFLKTHIFDPLAMTDTTFHPTDEQFKRVAKLYQRDATTGRESVIPVAYSVAQMRKEGMVHPANGAFSTAHDLARFCKMLLYGGVLDGNRILSEQSVREMTTDQLSGLGVKDGHPYGLGLDAVTSDHYKMPGITTAGSFGHPGSTGTDMLVDRKNDIVMITLDQQGGWPKGRNRDTIIRAFRDTAIRLFDKAAASLPLGQQ